MHVSDADISIVGDDAEQTLADVFDVVVGVQQGDVVLDGGGGSGRGPVGGVVGWLAFFFVRGIWGERWGNGRSVSCIKQKGGS